MIPKRHLAGLHKAVPHIAVLHRDEEMQFPKLELQAHLRKVDTFTKNGSTAAKSIIEAVVKNGMKVFSAAAVVASQQAMLTP